MRTRLAMICVLAAAPAFAQQDAHGYAYFAPGALTTGGQSITTLHGGGGIDVLLAKGIGLEVEIGVIGPREGFTHGAMGAFSPDATYHFAYDRRRKWDPFAAAGYTLFFRSGTLNAFNAGGGLNYWFARRIGFRGEFRDHVYTSGGAAHFWGARFGLSFR